jgi:4'-phosphopantetheinyl transferase EntD
MIERLLPEGVVAVEARSDDPRNELFAQERQAVARAVDKRRSEFASGRACARAALARLGIAPAAIPSGERGEPLWPRGIVGSITHCEGYRACAVARSEAIVTVGIDAEPHAGLPEGLLEDIARPEEIPQLRRLQAELPDVHWDRLLFSAKESVYKAWFPLARSWLGFEDAAVTFDSRAGTFAVRLLLVGPVVDGRRLSGFSGTWMVCEGMLLTAIAMGHVSPVAKNPSWQPSTAASLPAR